MSGGIIEKFTQMNPQTNSTINPLEISILNKPGSIFFRGWPVFYTKKVLRKLLGIQRGPDVVLKSLIRGLSQVNSQINSQAKGEIKFNINPSQKDLHKTVHVLANPTALEWAIKQKQLGKIDKLIAGPNVSILPSFDNYIFNSPEIDLILLPSEWTKDAYIKDSPSIADKIRVWPSGVEIPPSKSNDVTLGLGAFYIVFKKTFSDDTYQKIVEILSSKNVPFKTLIYGTFKQYEYFELLKNAKGMIYLQEAESQGIALQESWARDVPTLVWDSETYTYAKANVTIAGNVSAPYLTEESGMFFSSVEEFEQKFKEFDARINSANDFFRAREYCIQNLSDLASAKKYLEYISQS